MIILSFLFLLTATLYSSVGFGGGSTYLALLLIWDVPYLIFPVIALFCNIIDVQNIDIMNLAGFCRNCLSRWYREEAEKKGFAISDLGCT